MRAKHNDWIDGKALAMTVANVIMTDATVEGEAASFPFNSGKLLEMMEAGFTGSPDKSGQVRDVALLVASAFGLKKAGASVPLPVPEMTVRGVERKYVDLLGTRSNQVVLNALEVLTIVYEPEAFQELPDRRTKLERLSDAISLVSEHGYLFNFWDAGSKTTLTSAISELEQSIEE